MFGIGLMPGKNAQTSLLVPTSIFPDTVVEMEPV
jgi:hypothetical protein